MPYIFMILILCAAPASASKQQLSVEQGLIRQNVHGVWLRYGMEDQYKDLVQHISKHCDKDIGQYRWTLYDQGISYQAQNPARAIRYLYTSLQLGNMLAIVPLLRLMGQNWYNQDNHYSILGPHLLRHKFYKCDTYVEDMTSAEAHKHALNEILHMIDNQSIKTYAEGVLTSRKKTVGEYLAMPFIAIYRALRPSKSSTSARQYTVTGYNVQDPIFMRFMMMHLSALSDGQKSYLILSKERMVLYQSLAYKDS